MLMKSAYVLAAAGSLALMLFEGPRGGALTSNPEVGKVEHQAASSGHNSGVHKGNATVRTPFIFIGGIHGGK